MEELSNPLDTNSFTDYNLELPKDKEEEGLSLDAYDQLSEAVRSHYENLAKTLFMFPSSLLRELNELIDTKTITSAGKIQKVIKDRYRGSLKVPGTTAIRAYIVVRQKQKAVIDKAKKALIEIPDVQTMASTATSLDKQTKSVYQDLTLSVENKKSLLENLLKLCEARIEAIKVIQESDPTSGYEAVLKSYVMEARAITETLIKLRNELKNEGEKELELYINTKLASVIRSTIQAYILVHGEAKLDLFRNALKLKMKDNKLEEMSN